MLFLHQAEHFQKDQEQNLTNPSETKKYISFEFKRFSKMLPVLFTDQSGWIQKLSLSGRVSKKKLAIKFFSEIQISKLNVVTFEKGPNFIPEIKGRKSS